jgi:4-amino-4-deoxy-L-arabinose transferase-like glycosyltransferase
MSAFFVLAAWALRLPPALDNRFHADEALYGSWGLLIGRGQDPWLARAPVYKPPLLPYLVAGAQICFGNSEFAARFSGVAAGLLLVALAAALAHALYRERWTVAAAAMGIALSPLAILFSATAFTDPVMVTLGLAACVAAVRGRPGWAGVLAGLSFAAKQTGLAWLPLAMALGLSARASNPRSHTAAKMGAGFAVCVALVWAWDVARMAQGAESFWQLGVAGYGGLRLIWPQELWRRLREWSALSRYFFVSPVVNSVLLVGLPVLAWHAIMHRRYTREALVDLLLVSFSLAYILLHWLWAFPIWDRYLLPLTPVIAILLGRVLSLVLSYIQPAMRISPSFIVHCALFVVLVLPAFNAARSRYPVGGEHWAYDGIDQVAVFLRHLPEGAVVYQHWLGWHYGYYLFDAPVYLAYWPTPAWLAQDVQVFGAQEPRYITFPSWEFSARVSQALAGVGYELTPVLTATRRDGTLSFTVYHITKMSSMNHEQ